MYAFFALVRFEHNHFDVHMTRVHLLFVFNVSSQLLSIFFCWNMQMNPNFFDSTVLAIVIKTKMFSSMCAPHIVPWSWALYLLWFSSVYSIGVRRTYGLCLCSYFAPRYSCGYHHHIEVPTQKSRHVHFHSVVTSFVWTRAVVLFCAVEWRASNTADNGSI